ncbi:unnamed protein product, partial [Rotaria sp. Silwood1]
MTNNVIKHMDKRLQNKINRINKSDDEHNENNSGIITDRKFDFNQVYHYYFSECVDVGYHFFNLPSVLVGILIDMLGGRFVKLIGIIFHVVG